MDGDAARDILRELERRSGREFGFQESENWLQWLSAFIGGGDRESETPFFVDGGLILVSAQGVRYASTTDGDEILTTYFGPPLGGTYYEAWSWVEDAAFVLAFTFQDVRMPSALTRSYRGLRAIREPHVSALRDLLRGWAEAPR